MTRQAPQNPGVTAREGTDLLLSVRAVPAGRLSLLPGPGWHVGATQGPHLPKEQPSPPRAPGQAPGAGDLTGQLVRTPCGAVHGAC